MWVNNEAFTTNTDSSVREKVMFQTSHMKVHNKNTAQTYCDITETNRLYAYPTKISTFLFIQAPTMYS
jgi:hypothetical protein